jgi:hypothetical protein
MSNSAREHAQILTFCRLSKLLLEPYSLADVASDFEETARNACIILSQRPTARNHNFRAVAAGTGQLADPSSICE